MNPFLVLDLPLDTTDEQVRAAYQKLLRRYPPEQHPARFQIIQEAYEALRGARDRTNWQLLHLENSRAGLLEALESFARLPGRMKPPGAAAFRAFLHGCASAAMRAQSSPPSSLPTR
jgi:curved DNA-binding protein CbpA